MSEQSEGSARDGVGGQPLRRSAWPLIAALLVMLALGVAAGYMLGARQDAGDRDTGNASAPAVDDSAEASSAPTSRPVAVAPEGAALTPLGGPPESTMAMLETSTVDADATYAVTFRPYGYGPGQQGGSIVVRLEKATPKNASAERFNMTGRNILATVAGGEEIAEGGVYEGTLEFRPQGSLLGLVLRDVRPTD